MSSVIRKISIGADHIKKSGEILPWKKFNSQMAISIEYDLQY